MESLNIYESIAKRSQGDIYIGVVGPVRVGKSTFIKRFMDLLVVPNMKMSTPKNGCWMKCPRAVQEERLPQRSQSLFLQRLPA